MPAVATFTLPVTTGPIGALTLGQFGGDWIDDTTNYTGDWGILYAVTTATFSALTSSTVGINGAAPASSNYSGKVLPQGSVLYGRFSSITLTSGTIVAYRAKPL